MGTTIPNSASFLAEQMGKSIGVLQVSSVCAKGHLNDKCHRGSTLPVP